MATRSFQSPAPMLLIWGTASTPELTRSNATSTNTAADPAFLYMHIGLDIRRGAAAGAALPHSSSFAFSAAAAIKARPQWRFAFWPPPPLAWWPGVDAATRDGAAPLARARAGATHCTVAVHNACGRRRHCGCARAQPVAARTIQSVHPFLP
jgi:hypothetical protein